MDGAVISCLACGARNRVKPAPAGAVPSCGRCGAALPWLVSGSDATFERETNASVTVLVDLWAPWCGPCRMVAPVVEALAGQYAGRLKVVKLNVDDNPVTAGRYGVQSIPTLLVMKGGRVVDTVVGALPKGALEARLAPHLAPAGVA